jgi:N-acetylglucosamine kinase-like BadF-type ATPase
MRDDGVRWVVGIDAGATKTVALLGDDDGRIRASARGGGANLQVQGMAEVEAVLRAVLEELAPAGRPEALCVGMAGVDRPLDEARIRAILARLGQTRVRVENDALIALAAGSPDRKGIVVLSGTGSIAYGIDPQGRTARAGGFGSLLGDEGSGFWLGSEAMRAVVRASDGRGPATLLTALVFEALGISTAAELVPLMYEQHLRRTAIAALAPHVERASADGDGVASEIMRRAAQELALAARAVAGRLDFPGPFPVVLGGGVFRVCPRLVAQLTASLALPLARPTLLDREPAEGAVALARELLAARP